MARRLPFALLLAFVVLTPARAQDALTRFPLAEKQIRDNLGTDWYGLYLRDQKIGYLKVTLRPARAGDTPIYQVVTEFRSEVKAQGVLFRHHLTETMEYDDAPPYALRGGREVRLTDGARQETELLRDGEGFTAAATVNGVTTRKAVGAVPLTLADTFFEYLWLARQPHPGDRVRTQSFDFSDLRLQVSEHKLVSTKTALEGDSDVTYHEIEAHTPATGLTTLQRWDGQGKLLLTRLDGLIEARLESEGQAQDLGPAVDLFVQGLVKLDRPLGAPRRVTALVLDVNGTAAERLTSGPWQTVSRDATGRVRCRVGRAHDTRTVAEAEAVSQCLEATAEYPVDHPRVRDLAREAVGDARTDEQKIRRLVTFVHGYVRPSPRGKGSLVLDLLDKKAGDCTAYAALFCTLARAAGVPAREVSGLAYMGDRDRAFGGHAWNEVVLGGRWHPVDASAGQFEVDAARVSLGSDLHGGLNLLHSAGGLSFRLVSVERH